MTIYISDHTYISDFTHEIPVKFVNRVDRGHIGNCGVCLEHNFLKKCAICSFFQCGNCIKKMNKTFPQCRRPDMWYFPHNQFGKKISYIRKFNSKSPLEFVKWTLEIYGFSDEPVLPLSREMSVRCDTINMVVDYLHDRQVMDFIDQLGGIDHLKNLVDASYGSDYLETEFPELIGMDLHREMLAAWMRDQA